MDPTYVVSEIGRPVGTVYQGQTDDEATVDIDPTAPWIDTTDYSNPRRYGALGDDSHDDAPAFQAATDVTAVSKGLVRPSPGIYRFGSPVNVPFGVSYQGSDSTSTIIRTVACNAFELEYSTGFGNSKFSGLNVETTAGAGKKAIYALGSNLSTYEIYGLELNDMLIRGFEETVWLRSVRNFTMFNCWLQDTRRAMTFSGNVLVSHVFANKFNYGAGVSGSSGDKSGIICDTFLYTDDTPDVTGITEGFQFIANQVYGFDRGIDLVNANYVNIFGGDIQALLQGIRFATVQLGLDIDTFIQLAGASATHGIEGTGLASELVSKINIRPRIISDDLSSSSIGVQINGAGNQNQNHVTIHHGLIKNMAVNDILINNAGRTTIRNMRCLSTVPTNSISVPNVVSAYVDIDECTLTKELNYTAAELASGEIRLGTNIKNATTKFGHTLLGSATYDPPSLGDGVGTTTTVTVTGAALGDFAHATFSLDLQGITISTYVSSANTVSVRFQNESGGTLDLSSGTLRVKVLPALA